MTAMGEPAVQAIVRCALCAAGAGWLLPGPPAGGRLGVRTGSGRETMRSQPARKVPPATSVSGVRAGAVAAVVAGAALLGGSSAGRHVTVAVPLVVTAAVVAAAATWLLRRSRARTAADAMRADVVEACEAIASGLRAGLPPERVLSRTAADLPVLVPAATAARLGADVVPALRSTAAGRRGVADRGHGAGRRGPEAAGRRSARRCAGDRPAVRGAPGAGCCPGDGPGRRSGSHTHCDTGRRLVSVYGNHAGGRRARVGRLPRGQGRTVIRPRGEGTAWLSGGAW